MKWNDIKSGVSVYQPAQSNQCFAMGALELFLYLTLCSLRPGMQAAVDWHVTDKSCADLICRMTAYRPDDRITVEEALKHSYVFLSWTERLTLSGGVEAQPRPPPQSVALEGPGSLTVQRGQLSPGPIHSSTIAAPPQQLLGLSPSAAAQGVPLLGQALPGHKAHARSSRMTEEIGTWPAQPQQLPNQSAHQPVQPSSHAEHGCGVVATAGLRLPYVRVAGPPPGFGPRPGAHGDCLPVRQPKAKRERRALYDRGPRME